MNDQLEQALDQIAEEKGISREDLISMIEASLAAAFRKDYGEKNQNIVVEFDPETMGTKVFDVKTVTEEPSVVEEDPQKFILVEDAKKLKKSAKPGDEIKTDITPKTGTSYGRIAAQTAKQVMIQLIRQDERGSIYEEFKDRVGTIVTGTIARFEGGTMIVNLGRAEGIMPRSEQIPGEAHQVGERIQALIMEVRDTLNAVKIILSRSHPELIRRLFEREVP